MDRMYCAPLKCEMAVERCLRRHTAKVPSGGGKGSPRWPLCARCHQGAEVRAARPEWIAPRDTLPAELPSNEMRSARLRWELERLPSYDAGGLEPLREVALLTPDDPVVPDRG
jgi:hypothetical protein